MDPWLQLSLSAAAIFCGVVIAREAWLQYRATRRPIDDDQELSDLADVWREPEVTSTPITDMWPAGDEGEPLPAAMKAPPNLGGEGRPPYQGPNYVADEEVAEEMIGLPHFYSQPAQVIEITSANECVLDLAFDFEPGHVAPDGTIWSTRTERITHGVVQIPWSEQMKAARFGWEFVGNGDEPGKCQVRREHETYLRVKDAFERS